MSLTFGCPYENRHLFSTDTSSHPVLLLLKRKRIERLPSCCIFNVPFVHLMVFQ